MLPPEVLICAHEPSSKLSHILEAEAPEPRNINLELEEAPLMPWHTLNPKP